MESPTKEYAIAAIVITAAVCAVELFLMDSWLDEFLVIIVMTCGYVCTVLGLYMFFEARGEHSINGVDWGSYPKDEVRNILSYWGLFFTVGSILIMVSIALLMQYLVYGFVLMTIGIILTVIPLALKERARRKAYVSRSRGTKVMAFAAVSILAIVPCMYLINFVENEEAVTIEYGETSFSIRAPMESHTFEYEKIDQLTFDDNFDKGKRQWDYGTPNISSGTYKNSVFGEYTLMSYTKVKPCAFFFYEGEYYAFNQSDYEKTYTAFITIADHAYPDAVG